MVFKDRLWNTDKLLKTCVSARFPQWCKDVEIYDTKL